jgi:molybdenum cofactor synthesis domain-containing protein
VEDAVGLPLGHDITEIRPAEQRKHRAFRRGQVIGPGDVERLRDLGKSHVYVQEDGDPEVHEDDAALAVAPRAAGAGVTHDAEPTEGKITFQATRRGVLRVDAARLEAINALGFAALPTLPGNYPVAAGQRVAAFRILPLTCRPQELAAITGQLTAPLLRVDPYVVGAASILVTGTEVYAGRIRDGFIPRLTDTLAAHDVPVTASRIVPDDRERIVATIAELATDCPLLLVTGGTSVDPDDVTAAAMADAGVIPMVEGVPIQPGNNLRIGQRGETTVVAVPAAALVARATALDLLLPRLLAGERLDQATVAPMGLGGLAQPGAEEHFPDCTFGAGGWR